VTPRRRATEPNLTLHSAPTAHRTSVLCESASIPSHPPSLPSLTILAFFAVRYPRTRSVRPRLRLVDMDHHRLWCPIGAPCSILCHLWTRPRHASDAPSAVFLRVGRPTLVGQTAHADADYKHFAVTTSLSFQHSSTSSRCWDSSPSTLFWAVKHCRLLRRRPCRGTSASSSSGSSV
jgi:hypothetical protein